MKLKVVGLQHGINDFIATVKRANQPNFCESHKSGEEYEVQDDTGHLLMSTYPGVYQVTAYGDLSAKMVAESPKNKMAGVVNSK